MTKQSARLFFGSFAIALILIGAMAGFLIVDLSTDRYMPGVFAPIFQIASVGEEGVDLAFLGEDYRIDAHAAQQVQRAVWDWRGLLPRSVRYAGGAAVAIYDWATGQDG